MKSSIFNVMLIKAMRMFCLIYHARILIVWRGIRSNMTSTVIQNRYILNKQLGSGSMGEVHIATDRFTGQQVALKRVLHYLPTGTTFSAYTILALTNEFQMLASLRHPNIVSVLDYGIDQQQHPFFTMTYLEESVSFLRAGADKTIHQKVRLLLQLLDALKYLNRRGIIHRDLKPENILVVGEDSVRVLDFGLATNRPPSGGSNVSGTVAYMAPELFTGGMSTIMSDLYAVGVIAYQLLTGKHPYFADDMIQIVNNAISGQPDLRLLVDAISETLADTKAQQTHTDDTVRGMADENLVGGPTLRLDSVSHPSPPMAYSEPAIHGLVPGREYDSPYLLVNIIGRLLAKRPQDRYHDPQDVINDLCHAVGEDAPTRTSASRESFLQAAKFVGREHEVKQLETALDDAIQGHGSSWLIGGESGVGKSRLVNELRHLGMVKGALVLVGEALQEGAQPYQIWRNPVKRLVLNVDPLDADVATLRLLVSDIEQLLNRHLGDGTDETPISVDEAVLRLFGSCSQPIVLILEDIHWAAPESLALLAALQQRAPSSKLLIVANYRIDETPALSQQFQNSKQITLERLPETAMTELVGSMIGSTGVSPQFIRTLQRETEGNVFFLVESVRALADEAGGLENVSTMTLPAHLFTGGMQRIVQRRLDRVPEHYRPLLNIAAVSGRELEPEVLRKLSDQVDFEDWLTTLANASVIEFRNECWQFSHNKLRERAAEAIPQQDRRSLHHRVAETLEVLYPDGQRADALVMHWHYAENPEKEIHYIRIAGRRAEQMGAYDEARRLYTRALELADQPIRQIEFNNLLGGLYEYRSEYADAERHLLLALTMAREHDQPMLAADIIDKLAWIHIRRGQLDDAEQKADEVLKIARESKDDLMIMRALTLKGIVHHIKGEMQQAYDAFIEGLPIAEKSGEPYVLASHLNSLGAAEEGIGRADDAIRTLTRASETAQPLGNPALMGNIEGNLGRLLYNQQQYNEAQIHFMSALIAFRRAGNAYGDALAGYYLGYIALRTGNTAQAREYLRDSLKSSLEIGATSATLGGLVGAAEYYRLNRNVVRAAELIGLVRAHELTASDADLQRESDAVYAKLAHSDIDSALKRGEQLALEEIAQHEAAIL